MDLITLRFSQNYLAFFDQVCTFVYQTKVLISDTPQRQSVDTINVFLVVLKKHQDFNSLGLVNPTPRYMISKSYYH